MRCRSLKLGVALAAVILGVFGISALSFGVEYSAEQTTTTGEMKMVVKLYVKGEMSRQEVMRQTLPKAFPLLPKVEIYRPDEHILWMIDPSKKTYTEALIPHSVHSFARTTSNWRSYAKAHPKEVKFLGTEAVKGYVCDKYYDFGLKVTRWISKRLNRELKTSSIPGQKFSMEVTNIREQPQPLSLFEIPKGYRKTQLPQNSLIGQKGR